MWIIVWDNGISTERGVRRYMDAPVSRCPNTIWIQGTEKDARLSAETMDERRRFANAGNGQCLSGPYQS